MWLNYGLKAQKLLAQGIALGIMAICKAPCKGKRQCLVKSGKDIGNNYQNGYLMILCKVLRDTLQSITYYLPKYHVILFSLSFYVSKLHSEIKKKTSYFFCYSTHLHYL